jgi:ribonuclease H / adenosylcobalamin/alpha-ribazole phosphatase
VTGHPPAGQDPESITLDLGPGFEPPSRPAPRPSPSPASAPSESSRGARPAADAAGRVDEVVASVDGGARGNPGPAGIGAVVTAPDGTVLAEIAEGIGWATNNVAEYKALLAALECARSLGARRITVRADSKLVIEQMRGAWKVKNADLQPLWSRARELARGFERVTWRHVPRERNRAADALANRAMDDQGTVREHR